MKKAIYSYFVIAGLLLTVSVISASAQSARLIAANIPFNFVVKDKVLPAGEYTIERIQVAASEALKIQSRDGHITAIVPVRFSRTGANKHEAKLVFSQLGDQYFMSQAIGFEEKAAYTLPRSRTEDALAKSMTSGRPNTITIAGRPQ